MVVAVATVWLMWLASGASALPLSLTLALSPLPLSPLSLLRLALALLLLVLLLLLLRCCRTVAAAVALVLPGLCHVESCACPGASRTRHALGCASRVALCVHARCAGYCGSVHRVLAHKQSHMRSEICADANFDSNEQPLQTLVVEVSVADGSSAWRCRCHLSVRSLAINFNTHAYIAHPAKRLKVGQHMRKA